MAAYERLNQQCFIVGLSVHFCNQASNALVSLSIHADSHYNSLLIFVRSTESHSQALVVFQVSACLRQVSLQSQSSYSAL